MQEDTFTFSPEEDVEIFVRKWSPDSNVSIKGVIQVVHGMTEHGGRYENFARDLTQAGYVVYADDHRGYFKTAGAIEKLGKWKKGTWQKIITDLHQLNRIIKNNHPSVPIFLLGHSMGSFLAQNFIQEFGNDLSGVMLSGTNGYKAFLGFGTWLANIFASIYGQDKAGIKMKQISTGKINQDFEPRQTDFDWLSRDPKICQEFQENAWTGFTPSYRFYAEMLAGMKHIWKKTNEMKIPKSLPVYIFAGMMDPVGNKTHGILPLIDRYQNYGLKDVSYHFYEDGRHEMLNELNREEVIQNIISWLEFHLSKASN